MLHKEYNVPSLHPHPHDHQMVKVVDQLLYFTNDSRLQIYRRGVQTDQVVIDCTVEELVEQWPAVVEALNPKG
jgi:hypothetical protein